MKRLTQAITPLILLGLTLVACSQQPSASMPPQTTPSSPPQAQGPQTLPSPDPFRVQPTLTIKTAKSAPVYTGRGQFFLLIDEFPPDTDLTYVGSREGWLQVRTPAGEVGWLSAASATVSDSRGESVQVALRPGHWHLAVTDGPQVTVARTTAGVIQITLSGLTAPPAVQELQGGSLLLVPPGAPISTPAALDIGDSGLERVSLSQQGILLEVSDNPVHKVEQAGPGRLTVEFRPGLAHVERTATGWNLQTRGDLRPVLRQEGQDLVLDLPGAVAAGATQSALQSGSTSSLPHGITLTVVPPDPAPPQSSPPTRMPAGGLRLRLPAPATPYALCHTPPDQLELVLLPPGLKGKTILLDPGHGGEETGAEGVAGNLEKDVNLAVALQLQPLLEQAGAHVLMTRTTDARVLPPAAAATLATLSERTQADLALRSAQANQARADLVLSIHANYGEADDSGIETFWATANLNSSRSHYLAELVQQEVLSAFGLVDRGVKQRAFNVIRFSDAPAVLVELGFMSDAQEEQLLISRDGQQAAANALFRAIRTYFEQ